VKVGVLALQGASARHVSMLARLDTPAVAVRTPGDLDGVDALVLPGGESTTMSMLLESSGLFPVLAQRLADGMPAFGTCAGMILLGHEILDGRSDQRCFDAIDIRVRRNAFGRQVDSFEADLEFEAFDAPFHAVLIRAPWVEKIGDGVEVLARIGAGDDAGRIVAVRQGPVLATSFHPEISGDDRLHRYFVSLVRAEPHSAEQS